MQQERILPRDFPEPPEWIIPLSNSELVELGTFTAIWSQIDWILKEIIGHLGRIEPFALVLLSENMTTGPRVNLITRLCQDESDEIMQALKKLCDDNGGLIDSRNHVVHGLWGVHWEHEVDGPPTPACLYQKGKRDPIAAEKLVELSNRAAKFCRSLGRLLEQLTKTVNTRPRPHIFLYGKSPPQKPPPRWPPNAPPGASYFEADLPQG
jgi:hypothetical protein